LAGIFKAYDVRGVYPDELDETTAYQIGLAFRSVLIEGDFEHGKHVVVGHDMRLHSEPLHDSLKRGLRDSGLDVVDIGLTTTPMNYFAVGHLRAAGGVQVTASHNPARYNGFKFSRSNAQPVSGEAGIPAIESHVVQGDLKANAERGDLETRSVTKAYRDHLLSTLEEVPGNRRLKVVVDAANGMGCIYRPLLEAAGRAALLDFDLLYFDLDGTFPNHEPNPLKLENLRDLCTRVVEVGADLGVCFDGDADRAAFVDQKGHPVSSDLTTALIAGRLLGRDPGSAIVYDLRSSRAVREFITECGGVPIRERVGHSFIKATLRRHSGIFGGELAGHYYFRDNFYADCALMAVFEIVNLLRSSGNSLSELVAPLERYAKSPEINFEVDDKEAVMAQLAKEFSDGEIDYLDGITVQYQDWWFNVRPSNTEPLLRLVVEASTEQALEERQAQLLEYLGDPV